MCKKTVTRIFLCPLLLILAVSYCGRVATGHTGAINLFVDSSNNQLYHLDTFELGQFVEFLGTEISVDGPGFIVNFPANGVQSGAEFWLDIVQDLYYWDGNGLADTSVLFRLNAPEFDNQGVYNDSPVPEYVITSQTGRMTGMSWGTYNGLNFWEAHGLNFLEPLDAAAGMYGIAVQVKTTAHVDTEQFMIPFVYDPNDIWDTAAEQAGATRLRQAAAGHVLADLNLDGHVDTVDVDLLVAEMVAMTNDPAFDLSGDGRVDVKDLNEWRSQGGTAKLALPASFQPGDANLDGSVDVSDFNIWNANKFTSVAAWSRGDFDANGVVDVSDFNIWNQNKFTSAVAGKAAGRPQCRNRWGFSPQLRPSPYFFLAAVVAVLEWKFGGR